MPKQVDHDRRREEIAAFTLGLIRRVGVENATLRRIAKEGGFSMGVLTHYFQSKDEIIAVAFHFLAERTFAELDDLVAGSPPGLARLECLLEYMFPKADRPANFALWFGLWEGVTRNPHLAHEHRAYYERWRGYIKRSISEAYARGEIAEGVSIRRATDLIVASGEGLWVYSFMDPRRFSVFRLRQLVRELVTALMRRTSQPAGAISGQRGLLQLGTLTRNRAGTSHPRRVVMSRRLARTSRAQTRR